MTPEADKALPGTRNKQDVLVRWWRENREWTGRLGGQLREGLHRRENTQAGSKTESTSFLGGRACLTEGTACAKAQRHSFLCERIPLQNSKASM